MLLFDFGLQFGGNLHFFISSLLLSIVILVWLGLVIREIGSLGLVRLIIAILVSLVDLQLAKQLVVILICQLVVIHAVFLEPGLFGFAGLGRAHSKILLQGHAPVVYVGGGFG